MKCANKECKGDPTEHDNRIIVSPDGDMVCDKVCYHFYEKQQILKKNLKEINETN